jgi:NADPH:quinone reductase
MRAIVRQHYGGPGQLAIQELPEPEPTRGHICIEVKGFGLNHAETYMRKGEWGEVAKVSGIECVGLVQEDLDGRFVAGQKVAALMGGRGRTINGSYAEFTRVPSTNVVPIESELPWEELAAIPESYSTAWACLYANLALAAEQTLLIRGVTSALGQAALNIARYAGVHVLATTRNPGRVPMLEELGAKSVLLEGPGALASSPRTLSKGNRRGPGTGRQQHHRGFVGDGAAWRTSLPGRLSGRSGSDRFLQPLAPDAEWSAFQLLW